MLDNGRLQGNGHQPVRNNGERESGWIAGRVVSTRLSLGRSFLQWGLPQIMAIPQRFFLFPVDHFGGSDFQAFSEPGGHVMLFLPQSLYWAPCSVDVQTCHSASGFSLPQVWMMQLKFSGTRHGSTWERHGVRWFVTCPGPHWWFYSPYSCLLTW